jgi:peptidoglycan/xylan/chitin deacetylase (PgdA/CDA1 family)
MESRLIFRFDDIGPANRSAFQFIELMEALGRPYLLGVIPDALGWWMKRRLRQARYAGVFQHGTSHRNRGSADAPDEFPSALGGNGIAAELRRGRRCLENALGIEVTGYVPPWNRISEVALRVLEDEGYRFLSADSIHETPLRQMPVHIDVYSQYRPVVVRAEADIERDITQNLERTELVGVVLHPMSVPRNNRGQLRNLLEDNQGRMVTVSPWGK